MHEFDDPSHCAMGVTMPISSSSRSVKGPPWKKTCIESKNLQKRSPERSYMIRENRIVQDAFEETLGNEHGGSSFIQIFSHEPLKMPQNLKKKRKNPSVVGTLFIALQKLHE